MNQPSLVDCPVCGGAGQETATCRRCRADLSLLRTIAAAHAGCLTRAEQALRAGRFEAAAQEAAGALRLRRDASCRRLAAVCRLLAGDYRGALDLHRAKDDVPA